MFGKAIIAHFFEFVNDFESYFLIYAKNDGFIPIFLGKAAVFLLFISLQSDILRF